MARHRVCSDAVAFVFVHCVLSSSRSLLTGLLCCMLLMMTAATHRELFSVFYQSLMGESLEAMMAEDAAPSLSVSTFNSMLNDVLSAGGKATGIEEQVPGALMPKCCCFPLALRTSLNQSCC